MKHLLAIILTAASVTAAFGGDHYRILRLTSPDIRIGTDTCRAGSTFDGSARIYWTSPSQAMRVLNLDNMQQYVVGQRNFTGSVSSLDRYVRLHYTSTRSESDGTVALPEVSDGATVYADTTAHFTIGGSPVTLTATGTITATFDHPTRATITIIFMK